MVVFDEEKQDKRLEELHRQEEEELAQVLSAKFGVNYIDLTTSAINMEALRVVDEKTARAAKLAVFDIVAKKIKVAVLAPENPTTLKAIEDLRTKNFIPTVYMTSEQSLEKVWNLYKEMSYSFETKSGALDIANEEIEGYIKSVKSLEDVKKMIESTVGQKQRYKISRLLEIVIAGALALKASDIHVEPEEKIVRIRYRLDGVLVDILNIDKDIFNLLVSRLKLLSGMKLNVKNAQDGRFSIILNDLEIEIRASILPSAYNESIVLRVLNPNSIAVGTRRDGHGSETFEYFASRNHKPEGMVFTTGPTGSGKTTTLYAFLRKVTRRN
jgi:type IV pilus assembly protein PilB